MPWRGPRSPHDQTLSTKGWARVKQYWIRLHLPTCQASRCLLPGIPVDYTPPYTKRTSFNAGHIVPRWKAKALGWSVERMNSIANRRPEHRLCNMTDGARTGQKRQRAKIERVAVPYYDESRRW